MKILIVDDSATMRKIISRVLRQASIAIEAVVEAANGREGLAQLQAHPDIRLVLSDINMPEMNGVEFLRAVREQRTADQLPLFMITTEGGDAMRQAAMASGANGYITKPFTPETMQAALARYAA